MNGNHTDFLSATITIAKHRTPPASTGIFPVFKGVCGLDANL